MNATETENWTKAMRAARGRWTVDPIHNGQNNRRLLMHLSNTSDHTKGLFVTVEQDGHATAGTFEDAIPHIGEAAFAIKWSHKFTNQTEAISKLAERLGIAFLLGITHGSSPYLSR